MSDTFVYGSLAAGGDTLNSGEFETGTDVIDIADVLVDIGAGTAEGTDWRIDSLGDGDFNVDVSTDGGSSWVTMATVLDATVINTDVNTIV